MPVPHYLPSNKQCAGYSPGGSLWKLLHFDQTRRGRKRPFLVLRDAGFALALAFDGFRTVSSWTDRTDDDFALSGHLHTYTHKSFVSDRSSFGYVSDVQHVPGDRAIWEKPDVEPLSFCVLQPRWSERLKRHAVVLQAFFKPIL